MPEPRTSTTYIRLPDGWAGRVCTGETTASPPEDAIPMTLPTTTQWSKLLGGLLGAPETFPGYTVFKCTRSDAVYRCRVDAPAGPIEVVVKRGRARGLRRRLAFALRGGRERRNFNRALELRRTGVNVPMPLAVLQRRRPYPEACLVSAFVADLIELDTVAMSELPRLSASEAHHTKRAISGAVVEMFRCLHDQSLTHRDFKASNVLLRNWHGAHEPPTVWLVDLDGLRPLRSPSVTRLEHPLIRLAASLIGYAGVTRADQWRFLRGCAGIVEGVGGGDLKRRFRDLARMVDAYNRRARRRKSGKLDGFSGEHQPSRNR